MDRSLYFRASRRNGELQLNGVNRKANTSQTKPYVSRKRQLSECDSEARDAQGDAPVKRRCRPESSAATNHGMDDNNLEDGNLETTGFVKHAESMDYKYPCTEWQRGKCSKLKLKPKRKKLVMSTFSYLGLSPSTITQ